MKEKVLNSKRGTTFRFPFDIDRRIFLGLAIFFLILSFKPINNLFFPRQNINLLKTAIEKSLNNQQEDFLKVGANEDFVIRMAKGEITQAELITLNKKNWGLSIYKNDELIAWSNERLINSFKPEKDNRLTAYNENGVVGACLTRRKEINREVYTIKASFPLYFDYPNENIFLASKFNLHKKQEKNIDDYGFHLSIWSDNEPNPDAIKLNLGESANFALFEKFDFLDLYDKNPWHFFLAALPFILFGISIHTYFKVSVKRNPILYFSLLLGTVIILRILTYAWGIPDNFNEFNLFNPDLFAGGIFNRSLGDVFINSCLIFWILIFFLINVQFKVYRPRKRSSYFWFASIYLIILYVVGSQFITLCKSLIYDSSLDYDLTNYLNINFEVFIGISSFLIGFTNFLLLIFILHRYLTKAKVYPYLKYVAPIIIPLFSFFFIDPESFSESIAIFSWASIVFILLDLKWLEVKFDFNSSRLLFWFIFLSLSCSIIFYHYNNRKEQNLMANQGYNILHFENKGIIDKLELLQQKLASDSLVKNFYKTTNRTEKYNIGGDIINTHFLEYVQSYVVSNHFLDSNSIGLQAIIDSSNLVGNKRTIYFYKEFGHEKYIIPIKSYISDGGNPLVIVFDPIFNQFPAGGEHLTQRFLQRIQPFESFGYGFYQDSILTKQINSTTYPYFQNINVDEASNKKIDNDRLYIRSDNYGKKRIILIEKKDRKIFRFSTLFAYFFSVIFLLVSTYIFGNIVVRSNFKWKRFLNLFGLTLRMRIHLSILTIELVSFVVIGVITILFYSNRSNNKIQEDTANSNQQITEKIKKIDNIEFIIQKLIENDQSYSKAISKLIPNLSSSFFNLYDDKGKLIFTNDKQKIKFGIFAMYVNPLAKYKLQNSISQNALLHEQVENLNYVSSYSYLRNNSEQPIAIIQIPNLISKKILKTDIANVVITLINIYALIFLLSSILAFVITRSLTRSFSTIVSQFTKIDLNRTNQQLNWPYSDEIGLLVKEYNRTLIKLENSTALLAKSERENAWREMAKQIAHEIKNPLTPMRLSLQMLQMAIKNNDPNVKEKTQKMTDTVLEQIAVLTRIASNFAEFAKMSDVQAQKESLREIIKSATGIYSNNVEAEFLFMLPDKSVFVYIDKVKLIRVITNVIQNAIQAVTLDKVAFITLTTTVEKANFIRVSISDNGIGIDSNLNKKIFEPNFTTKNSGSGLGLAMCKDIMNKSGGDISFNTTVGKGSTFHLDIPIYKEKRKFQKVEDDEEINILRNIYGIKNEISTEEEEDLDLEDGEEEDDFLDEDNDEDLPDEEAKKEFED